MITTTTSPTINPVTPAPKTPANAVTAIPQAKASYNSGQLLPMIGTPEYKKAQELANASRASAPTPTPTPTQVKPQTAIPSASQEFKSSMGQINKENEQAYQKFQDFTTQMQNGSVPLNPYEQSQIDATRNSFNAIIESQKLENRNYEGGIKVANEARGLSMYSPEMAQGEILAAVSEGNKKVADLNTKMQQSLVTMEQGFRENKYSLVKDAYNTFISSQREKTSTIENTYKVAVEKEKAIAEAQQDSYYSGISSLLLDDSFSFAEKKAAISEAMSLGLLNREQVKDIQTQLKDSRKDIESMAKTVAENGGTPKQVQAVLNSNDLSEAFNNASGLLSKVETGTIGEYKYYEAQERKAGRVPLSFMDFKNYSPGGGANTEAEDKLRKEYLDRAEVKAYQRARGAYDRLNAIVPDRTDATYKIIANDDAALKNLIRQEAILTDPSATKITPDGSVIESESLSGIVEQKFKKLTEDQNTLPIKVKQLVNSADKTYEVARKGAEAVQGEIKSLAKKRGVEVDLPGVFNPGQRLSEQEDMAEQSLKNFTAANPDKVSDLANKMDIFERTLGRPVTASEFLQAFPEYK